VDNAKNRTFNLIFSVFNEYIGYDYPAESRKFIIKNKGMHANDKDISALCNSIKKSIDLYSERLRQLPDLVELRVDSRKSRLFRQARHKEMQSILEKAQEKSVLMHLATKVPLKAGVSFFSKHEDKFTEKTPLASFEKSIAVPRSEAIDKVGSEINFLNFRTCKRSDI
jgi:hypothetical protein